MTVVSTSAFLKNNVKRIFAVKITAELREKLGRLL